MRQLLVFNKSLINRRSKSIGKYISVSSNIFVSAVEAGGKKYPKGRKLDIVGYQQIE
jgi:hypothetical protein